MTLTSSESDVRYSNPDCRTEKWLNGWLAAIGMDLIRYLGIEVVVEAIRGDCFHSGHPEILSFFEQCTHFQL